MGAGATRTMFGSDEMGGPRFRGGFSEPPKPQRTWEDRVWEPIDHSRACLLFAVKHAAREVPINGPM